MIEPPKDDAALIVEAQNVVTEVLTAPIVDEATAVRAEGEAVTACMVALASLPPHRREHIIDFLKERFSRTSYLEMLCAVAKDASARTAEHRAEVVRLQREIVAAKNTPHS